MAQWVLLVDSSCILFFSLSVLYSRVNNLPYYRYFKKDPCHWVLKPAQIVRRCLPVVYITLLMTVATPALANIISQDGYGSCMFQFHKTDFFCPLGVHIKEFFIQARGYSSCFS